MSGEDYDEDRDTPRYADEDDGWGDQFEGHNSDEDGDTPHFDCLFPDECCIPGPHWTDECHTAEMLEQQCEPQTTPWHRFLIRMVEKVWSAVYRFLQWTAEKRQKEIEIEDDNIPF